uniref:Uncharacterized protein n=1 Tax=Arundo donax TaxID=35708 RepID=A0A0A9DXZ0_ARUDO
MLSANICLQLMLTLDGKPSFLCLFLLSEFRQMLPSASCFLLPDLRGPKDPAALGSVDASSLPNFILSIMFRSTRSGIDLPPAFLFVIEISTPPLIVSDGLAFFSPAELLYLFLYSVCSATFIRGSPSAFPPAEKSFAEPGTFMASATADASSPTDLCLSTMFGSAGFRMDLPRIFLFSVGTEDLT